MNSIHEPPRIHRWGRRDETDWDFWQPSSRFIQSALLRAAAEFVPDGAELTVETILGIPLYDADVETADGIPERVSALKEAIVAADGLLLATPEYNNSMPGVFKNAIDWLSRPPADIGRVFGGKPVLGRRPVASARASARTHGCRSCGP